MANLMLPEIGTLRVHQNPSMHWRTAVYGGAYWRARTWHLTLVLTQRALSGQAPRIGTFLSRWRRIGSGRLVLALECGRIQSLCAQPLQLR